MRLCQGGAIHGVRADLDGTRSQIDPDEAHPGRSFAVCGMMGRSGLLSLGHRSDMFGNWEQNTASLTGRSAPS